MLIQVTHDSSHYTIDVIRDSPYAGFSTVTALSTKQYSL